MASNGSIVSSKDANQEKPGALDGLPDEDEARLAAVNKSKEIQFKASHGLLVVFFLWILYVLVGCCMSQC